MPINLTGKAALFCFRAHGKIIIMVIEEFFANLALFDLPAFSKLTKLTW
jgi:hypothetical protein